MDREKLLDFMDIKEIPSLPEAARLAIKSSLDGNKSFEEISNIIMQNPSLTLKILKIANSAFYSRRGQISNIKDAIILLGYKTIKSIILSITIRDIFKEKELEWFDYKKLWLHLISTAIISREITSRIKRKNEEEIMYSAGLLHDIGKSIFLISAESEYHQVVKIVKDEGFPLYRAENKVFGFDHTDVAAFLLDHWGIPEKIINPIRDHHLNYNGNDRNNLIENYTLSLANQLSKTAGFKVIEEEPQYQNTKEIADKIGLLNDELDKIIINMQDEIRSILSVLEIPGSYVKGIYSVIQEANNKLGEILVENRKISIEITAKKGLLESLNELSLFLLRKKNPEELLKGIALRLSSTFKMEYCNIYFHLNENRSIVATADNPTLSYYSDNIDTSVSFIQRDSIYLRKDGEIFRINSHDGREIGIINYKVNHKEEIEDIGLFLDYISVSLNNLYLEFLTKLKSEKLQIAVKRLKEEIEARRQSNILNESIIENSPVGIIITDMNGNIILHNKISEKLLGTVLKGKNILKDIKHASKLIVENLKTVAPLNKSFELCIGINEQKKYLYFQYRKLRDTNNYLFIIQDITKRKINENLLAEKKNIETLGELAAGIAHNLRSPLAAAKGISELIVDDIKKGILKIKKVKNNKEYEDEEIKENLIIISKSIEKTFNIINSILELSRGIQSSELFKDRFSLKSVVEEAYTLIEHRLKNKNITLKTDLNCAEMIGNRNMFTQIILNLLNNSIDAIENNGWIKVTCNENDQNFIIEVIDNGRGISPSDLKRVFEPFYSTSGEATGRGIGLSITKKMVLAHKGTIKAINRPQGGTIIQIIIPKKQEK